jgi:nascent polypeptide-associated complex subunit alpha
MFGDMKKMMGMMKQLGINQQEIDAERVIIECKDKKIVIDNPNVAKIKFQGQETFQISGESREESIEEDKSEEDIKTIMEKTGCKKEEAEKALKKSNGDLAEAILALS